MLTVDEIKEKMKDRKIKVVAEAVDMHENTIYRFLAGRDSRWSTVEKLSAYLEGGNDANT